MTSGLINGNYFVSKEKYIPLGSNGIILKRASEAYEFDLIHRLNYLTFVEEIPQHSPNPNKVLEDKFHFKNIYLIAKENENIVGMVCYNNHRPFSLDQKLPNLDEYLPGYNNIVEVRLLAIVPTKRSSPLFYHLLKYLCNELIHQNIDIAVISGTTRQLKLYQTIGFTSFGPMVGNGGAYYQPMYITVMNLKNILRDDKS